MTDDQESRPEPSRGFKIDLPAMRVDGVQTPGQPSVGQPPVDRSTDGSDRSHVGCGDAVAQLHAYLDGNIDDQHRAGVDAHLGHCPPCDAAFRFQRQLLGLVATRCRTDMPADVRQRLIDSLPKLGSDPGLDLPGR